VLATIGLLGCQPPADVDAPITIDQQPEGEPAGRGSTAKSGTSASESTGIPESREWCGAIIDTRPRPLPRTSSFLLAWNEIRIAGGRATPGPIPLNEHDARLAICGSPTCQVETPKPIEFNENGKISIGTVVSGDAGELLVIPDLSPFFGSMQCSGATRIAMQDLGDHLRVTAYSEPSPRYHHHGYYGGSFGYGGCYSTEGRHDVLVDVATGMIALEIEHRGAQLGVTASEHEGLKVTLTGCDTTLELSWTE
jgi:hypothetical protein